MNTQSSALKRIDIASINGRVWRRFVLYTKRRPARSIAIAGLCLYAFAAVVGPMLASYGPYALSHLALKGPSGPHPFGTDELGRDLLSRCLTGIRIGMQVGFSAVIAALCLGGAIGFVCGFTGGVVDAVLMRCMDVLLGFPSLLLAMAAVAAFGSGEIQVALAVAVVFMPIFARLGRVGVLEERGKDYVVAAKLAGAGGFRILMREIFPNVMEVLVLQTSLSVSLAILTEAGLSFLGLGVPPPAASLGSIISESRAFMRGDPTFALFPGAILAGMVLCLQGCADALSGWWDPRRR
jgi:peptide/nickel transport system permease protein